MADTRPMVRRNESLNVLKAISCVVVIFLHCHFPGMFGDMIVYALRFSVPVFFMISGFYAFGKPVEWFEKKIVRTLRTTVLLEILYALWNLVEICLMRGKAFSAFIDFAVSAVSHPLTTLLTGTFFNGTLWYMYAAFWIWCILALLCRYHLLDRARFLIPVLLFAQIVGRFLYQNHFDIHENVYLFRNALFFGLPFTLLGYQLAVKQARIREALNVKKVILLVLIGHVLIVAEYLLSRQYMDAHLSTVVISLGLFLFTIVHPQCAGLRIVRFIGDKLSMWTYYIHALVVALLAVAGEKLGLSAVSLFLWLKPLIACALSLAISLAIYAVQRRLSARR